MAGSGSDNKTEKATPKKRKDERKKGNVFSSKDIISVASILIIFTMLKILFPYITNRIMLEISKFIEMAGTTETLTAGMNREIYLSIITTFCFTALPLLFTSILVGVVASGIQTRFLFATESLKPKFSRLNPLQGLKKMVSLKSIVELIKNIIKVIIIAYVVYDFLVKKFIYIAKMLFLDINQSIAYTLESTMELIYTVCLIFIFIAGLDYMYQKWDYERQIRMSKHDVKEEYKQLEGDPQIKGKIKERQRKISLSRMMQAVPSADVVIRNPQHYAIALKYDIDKDNAPIVVAMGQDELALRIVKVAQDNNVYTIENKPLARAIYAQAELNREIPMDFYTAVAEILAFVYGIKSQDSKQ